MKRLLLLVGLLCALILSSSSIPSITNAAEGTKKVRAEIRFDQPVNLMGETLQEQLPLSSMTTWRWRAGDACTHAYKGNAEVARKTLSFLFIAKPQDRNKASHFTVRSRKTPSGLEELTRVPVSRQHRIAFSSGAGGLKNRTAIDEAVIENERRELLRVRSNSDSPPLHFFPLSIRLTGGM